MLLLLYLLPHCRAQTQESSNQNQYQSEVVPPALQEVSDSSPWAAKANLGGMPSIHLSPVLPKNPHIVLVLGAGWIASQLASLPFDDDIRAAVKVDPAVVSTVRAALVG